MCAMATKSSDPRGLKRVCASCGIRFYDLNKRPVHCPKCQTEFTGELKLKSRRGRAAAAEAEAEAKLKEKAVKPVANDDDLEVAAEEGVVSLEEVVEMENPGEEEEDITLPDADIEEIDGLDDDDLEDDVDVAVDEKE